MESFFGLIQRNASDRCRRKAQLELRTAILHVFWRTRHWTRSDRRLGKLTATAYEQVYRNGVALAAQTPGANQAFITSSFIIPQR